MAKAIKDLKGRFDYTGVLSSLNMTKTSNNKEKLDFQVTDNEMGAVAKLQIWKNDTASYYNFSNKCNVFVNGDIERQMKEVKATNIGKVHQIVMTSPKEGAKTYYITANVIDNLLKLKENVYTIRVTGELSFREYNGRPMKDYNIETIEIFAPSVKPKHALRVNFPIVIGDTQKNNLVSRPYASNITSLVKTRLDGGGYGYRPLQLTLDNSVFLDGNLKKISATNGMAIETIMNEKILPIITKPLNDIKGYGVMYMDGRLKVGEVSRKPTLDDLNPMERIALELQGQQAIDETLSKMNVITKYSDITYIVSIGLGGGQLVEPISEGLLNLARTEQSNSSFSNPMMDIANSFMDSIPTETPTKPKEEPKQFVEEPIKNEATIEDLTAHLGEEGSKEEVIQSNVTDTQSFEDEFPF